MWSNGYKLTNEEFVQQLVQASNGQVVLLSEYVNSRTKLNLKCLRCGNEYAVEPRTAINGVTNGCQVCYKLLHKKKRQKTPEQFEKEVKELVGDEYTFLEPYDGASHKIKCRHNKCGNVWSLKPNWFLCGRRCPKCIPKKPLKTQEQFERELRNKTNGKFVFLKPYAGNDVLIPCKHVKCGYVWNVRPNDILHGHGCPKCTKQIRWTHEMFERCVDNMYHGEYSVLSEYQGMNSYITMKHNTCGHVWNTKPSDFRAGHGCPKCASSKGEEYIRKWLNSQHINNVEQKRFDDCRDKRSLPFDFYLPTYNLIIEYDGRQHFEQVESWSGEHGLEERQRHDAIKNQYCKNNNINLLRIPYTVKGDDIGTTINNELIKLNKLAG